MRNQSPVRGWPFTCLALAFTASRLIPAYGYALMASPPFLRLLAWHPMSIALRALSGLEL